MAMRTATQTAMRTATQTVMETATQTVMGSQTVQVREPERGPAPVGEEVEGAAHTAPRVSPRSTPQMACPCRSH